MNLVLYRNCNVSLVAHILTRCCPGDELSQSAYAQKFFSASLRCTGERKDGKTIFSIRGVLLA